MKTKLSVEKLHRLFTAAARFNELKSWSWLEDEDILAIEEPDTKKIAYCCVMGSLGECIGIAVYVGDVGLNSYFYGLSGEYVYDPEAMHMQNSLLITFEDREDIEKEDYELIKKSGVKFRGKKQWPMFRKYESGYFPWFLNDEELKFITVILEQAYEFALDAKQDKGLVIPKEDGKCRIRKWKDDQKWGYDVVPLHPKKESFKIPAWKDEIRLRNLKKKVRKVDTVWEIDRFYSPSPIADEERPYYPMVMVVVDGQIGQILGMHLAKKDFCLQEFQEYFVEVVENVGMVPSEVVFDKKDMHKTLEDILNKLGVKSFLAEELHMMPEIKYDMYDFFQHGFPNRKDIFD
ncbi:DUF7309 domain-containing protein [Thermotalea metallivorans]|uniref:Uncharacterized protein n=1 Tax=Thermotalea metallivorans TaxID=520762 RepID=A0A140LA96_9FIRM|nr:hypothetical protein [Thermotalea metallivorans]KXG77471.1 hypothetical protein AN619_04560 [Thermotalea metallivorans]